MVVLLVLPRVDSVCEVLKHIPARRFCQKIGASVIDILANPKIRLDGVKRMTQIQNISQSFAETKYSTVAAREHTLAPPGRHHPRHSRIGRELKKILFRPPVCVPLISLDQ